MTEEEDSSKEHAQIVEYLAQNKVLLKVRSSKNTFHSFIHCSFLDVRFSVVIFYMINIVFVHIEVKGTFQKEI